MKLITIWKAWVFRAEKQFSARFWQIWPCYPPQLRRKTCSFSVKLHKSTRSWGAVYPALAKGLGSFADFINRVVFQRSGEESLTNHAEHSRRNNNMFPREHFEDTWWNVNEREKHIFERLYCRLCYSAHTCSNKLMLSQKVPSIKFSNLQKVWGP